LRQEVLEGLGWRIHRIWSPEWFSRQREEVERLRQALEMARKVRRTPEQRVAVAPAAAPPAPAVRKGEGGTPGENGGDLPGTTIYRLSPLKVGKEFRGTEIHNPTAHKEVVRLLLQLVKAEAPIHLEVVVRRLRQAWGLDRAGDRVRRTVDEAVTEAESNRQLRRRGDFLWPLADGPVVVRVPDPKNPDSNREVEHIALEELQAALRLLGAQGGGIGEDALLAQTARVFGFGKLGDAIRQRLTEALEKLRRQGVCTTRSGAITLGA